MIIAIITIDIEKLIALATEKIRLAKRRNGIIGWRTSLSQTTRPPVSTMPIASGTKTSIRLQPPTASARPTAINIGVVEPRISAAPTQSMEGLRLGRGSRRKLRLHSTSATAPSGMLIQKIQCQVR